MKIRQTQASATYLLPQPGELNKRVVIRQREDVPVNGFGVTPFYPEQFPAWAKISQTSATTYRETAQTDNAVTHYVIIRWRRGITSDFEVVHGEQVYRVQRGRDLNDQRRFLLLECTELGEFKTVSDTGGQNGNSLFTR